MESNVNYNENVLDHFRNPRNMGEMKNPDAEATVGNPTCLLPNEKIFLNGDFQSIKNATKGDVIVSHSSLKNQILNVFSRFYRGNVITFRNAMGNISLTPEHLIYALKLPDHYDFYRNKHKRKLIPSWYHAGDLNKGDVVLYPIDKKVVDIKYLEVDVSKSRWDFRSPIIPKKILLNDDLLRLFGYFIAEGNIQDRPSKTYISFAFNIAEKDFVEDVERIVKDLFGVVVKVKEVPDKKTVIVFLYNAQIARFFKKLFGNGAQNKKIPEFIMNLPIQKQKALIRGLWRGDGCVNLSRNGPRGGYASISYQLIQQIKFLLLRQGIIPSIYIEEEKTSKWANHKKAYRIHVGQRDSLKKLCSILDMNYNPVSYGQISTWSDKNFTYLPITKLIKKKYSGYVYNLEIEIDHSFVSESFILHNCGDVMKIMLKIEENRIKDIKKAPSFRKRGSLESENLDGRNVGVSQIGNFIISDIKFQTMGCAAAIATSSMLTEIAKGKTLDEAKKITSVDVAKALGELPPIKIHCSNLAADALKKAIENFEKNNL